MNTSCPSCDEPLKRRYMGFVSLACPKCRTSLRYNLHLDESALALDELGFTIIAITGVVCFFLFGLLSAIICSVIIGLSFWFFLKQKKRKNIPKEWRRWRID
jgi:Mn2+/Fe2+ NRAMP family transporter